MLNEEITRRGALGAAGAAVGAVLATVASASAAEEGKSSPKLFEKVDPALVKKGAPPIVFYPVPDSYIVFKTKEELKAWEDEVRTRLGVQLRGTLGSGSESCSAGCSDDCDQ